LVDTDGLASSAVTCTDTMGESVILGRPIGELVEVGPAARSPDPAMERAHGMRVQQEPAVPRADSTAPSASTTGLAAQS
jgi:hypothetical protein